MMPTEHEEPDSAADDEWEADTAALLAKRDTLLGVPHINAISSRIVLFPLSVVVTALDFGSLSHTLMQPARFDTILGLPTSLSGKFNIHDMHVMYNYPVLPHVDSIQSCLEPTTLPKEIISEDSYNQMADGLRALLSRVELSSLLTRNCKYWPVELRKVLPRELQKLVNGRTIHAVPSGLFFENAERKSLWILQA